MKLMTLALGIVGGIYLSLQQPELAARILVGFIDFINWLSAYAATMLQGI
jgi:hypothetical protein